MTVLPFLAACGGGNAHVSADGGDTLRLEYAQNLEIVDFDGYSKVTIRNPWDTTAILNTYLLVPDSLPQLPEGLPEGTVVRVPLKRGVVYSSVHIGLLSELGAADMVKGVCDAKYVSMPEISRKISTGEIADCGVGTSPVIEKIISLNPDAIMLSPFENSGNYGKLGQLGIPIIECADYMEASPLGRAEWMKFYGRLVGKAAESDSLFLAEKSEYENLKAMAENVGKRPRVLMDRLYGNVWYVPARISTMGAFIRDAGGRNPFDSMQERGSVALSGEKVLMDASDADVWLIRYSLASPLTMKVLGKDNAIYPQFKAFKDQRVYGCNTTSSLYYSQVPFHPTLLLRDMVRIIHPGLLADSLDNRYFFQLK